MRNVKLTPVTDKAVLSQPMTLLTADAKPPGRDRRRGPTLVVDHTTDNKLVSFRFRTQRREDAGGGGGFRS